MANSSKNISPLSQSALDLDADFSELEALSGQLERLSLDSNRAFAKAQQLLAKFNACSLRIGSGVQSLAQALESARANAERAAELVATRAALVRQRQEEHETLITQFGAITEQVRKVSSLIAQIRKPGGIQFSAEERAALPKQLAPLDDLMEKLINEARRIKLAAREANLFSLQRDAESLEQSMASARRRLSDGLETAAEQANALSSFATLARPAEYN
ncbi:MAG: hypothetical protein JST16_11265 [Bdellovibrionales bacterium]|nr:hypothetical protein [Bdellovibrionales bacterium]